MAMYHEAVTIEDLDSDALAQVLPPRDLGHLPMRAFTFAALVQDMADLVLEHGPTETGPWIAEDLSATTIPTLGANDAADYAPKSGAHRWWRVRAKSATPGEGEEGATLTVYVNAIG